MGKSATTQPKQKDYNKSGHCSATIEQEKDCLHFIPIKNSIRAFPYCLNQGLGNVCDHKVKK